MLRTASRIRGLGRLAIGATRVNGLLSPALSSRGGEGVKGKAVAVARCVGLVCLGLLSGCQTAPETRKSEPLQAGAAEVDITAPVGYRMAGYFDERVATGVHDPLQAKAIVLRQGQTQIALVCCDLIGLSLNVSTNARALASRQTGIPVSNIVISATHSHTGPLFDDVRQSRSQEAAAAKASADPQEKFDYPAWLVPRLAQVIAAAQANLRPVHLQAGVARQERLTFNRRYWMKNGTALDLLRQLR